MVIELPVPIRVGSGKYNLLLVPVEVPANTGGRVVEREQGLGVIRAAMRAAIVRAGEAYLKATFP